MFYFSGLPVHMILDRTFALLRNTRWGLFRKQEKISLRNVLCSSRTEVIKANSTTSTLCRLRVCALAKADEHHKVQIVKGKVMIAESAIYTASLSSIFEEVRFGAFVFSLSVLAQPDNGQSYSEKLRISIAKIFTCIRLMNLFASSPPSVHERHLKTERISTRLYIFLLTVSFLVLLAYKISEEVTHTVTISLPSFDDYQLLYIKERDNLFCPCSTIATEYHVFLYIEPVFHQLCTSDFVSERWLFTETYIPPVINIFDMRRTRRAIFSAMTSFCSLANQTIRNAMISLNSTQMISTAVVPENEFHKNTAQFVADFILSVTNAFSNNLEFSRTSAQTNQILSGFITNAIAAFVGTSSTLDLGVYYRDHNTCNCAYSPKCSSPNIIYSYNGTYFSSIFTVPELLTGCYLDEAVRQSSLKCFFNQSCVDALIFYLNFSTPLNATALNASVYSTFRVDSVIDDMVRTLMVEQWLWHDSFQLYYQDCRPSICFYRLKTRATFIVIFTTLIGLFGGLMKALQIITPRVVQFLRRQRQPSVPSQSKFKCYTH